MKVLTATEVRIVEALAETIFPADEAIPVDVRSMGIARRVDDYLMLVPERERYLMRAMFALFEVQHKVRTGTRFSKAALPERHASLRTWDESNQYYLRMPFQALRSTLILMYMADPEVDRFLGLSPGDEVLARRRRNAAAGRVASSEATSNGRIYPKALEA